MELLSFNIKRFQETELRKKIFYTFRKTRTLKELLIFRGMEFFSLPREKFHILQQTNPQKCFLDFLKRKLFLYFWKEKPQKKLFTFQEMERSRTKLKKLLIFLIDHIGRMIAVEYGSFPAFATFKFSILNYFLF